MLAPLKTVDLAIGYATKRGEATVLYRDINLSLLPGTITTLLGANGAGKSTLLRTISGVQMPLEGYVEVNGTRLADIKPTQLALSIAMVYTDVSRSTGGLTVRELVSLGRYPHTGFFGRLSADDRTVVSQAMESVGVEHKADAYVGSLSDGERRKVMIAKALAQDTPIIILDEPTAYLDVASRLDIMRMLAQLVADNDKSVLLSTHDVGAALAVSHRLWLMPADSQAIVSGDRDHLIHTDVMNHIFSDSQNVVFNPHILDYTYPANA